MYTKHFSWPNTPDFSPCQLCLVWLLLDREIQAILTVMHVPYRCGRPAVPVDRPEEVNDDM